jgi:hypothetical protein
VRLSEHPIDEMHQICCAQHGYSGAVHTIADLIYRVHVWLLVVLIRAGRRWQ